ncbi:ACT domain-containing protein [Egibacter rhizosphaerae]|uniref:ACT domain-containing protein n=1 Tax=Egibacter rhizosphaerae TaxID=1670831 RepID=A0A411YAU4_9ACTN|nr:ACT domain-containing protein [Egibacter rhizosphaerae]QBI18298.1 ACT domain-containing protein [Egibacter rhizosphaerae]
MAKDIVLIPDDRPGMLARLGEAAEQANINIEGVAAFTGEGKGVVHVLVPDAEHALEALRAAGLDVRAARDVLVVDCPDEPGALGKICRRLADAGVNIQQAYLATQTRLVLAVDDPDTARNVLG